MVLPRVRSHERAPPLFPTRSVDASSRDSPLGSSRQIRSVPTSVSPIFHPGERVMHKDWRFTSFKALTVTLAACALALNAHGAFAEGLPSNGGTTDPDSYARSYVLESSGATWGDAQDAAVIASGGTVTFKH